MAAFVIYQPSTKCFWANKKLRKKTNKEKKNCKKLQTFSSFDYSHVFFVYFFVNSLFANLHFSYILCPLFASTSAAASRLSWARAASEAASLLIAVTCLICLLCFCCDYCAVLSMQQGEYWFDRVFCNSIGMMKKQKIDIVLIVYCMNCRL